MGLQPWACAIFPASEESATAERVPLQRLLLLCRHRLPNFIAEFHSPYSSVIFPKKNVQILDEQITFPGRMSP
jgi:hypothetical protein